MEDHIVFREDVPALDLLDQRALPAREERLVCRTHEEVCEAIKTLAVRGAPAIGVAGAHACALATLGLEGKAGWQEELERRFKVVENARPTAVNLSWAVNLMRELWADAAKGGELGPRSLYELIVAQARRIQEEDIASCRAMGKAALELVQDGDTILTHCNAGALATAGYGTALGVVRAAHEAGKKISVIADETRPLLQGARLTAWELLKDGIDVTLACDNACATLMAQGKVNLVVVGADRIAANGDTANKIGTLGVAVLARHWQIPFYVAAPVSTIDLSLADGSLIPIERRSADEVTHVREAVIAPAGIKAHNFAFDVTPNELVTAIITEKGIVRPPLAENIRKICFPGKSL